MFERSSILRSVGPLALLLCALALLAAGELSTTTEPASGNGGGESSAKSSSAGRRRFTTEYVTGKVVWLDEALQRLYGVTADPAVAETQVALETAGGRLLPIVPDIPGRAFVADSRLRNIELKLLVRRYAGVPMIQVMRVLKPTADGLYEIDYWCDVCAISMVTLKACECCQGPTRLRQRRVEDNPDASVP